MAFLEGCQCFWNSVDSCCFQHLCHSKVWTSVSLSPSSDANECEMFGSDICKNGQCSNLFSTYTCYCRSGFYYDNIRLECVGKKYVFMFFTVRKVTQINMNLTIQFQPLLIDSFFISTCHFVSQITTSVNLETPARTENVWTQLGLSTVSAALH